MALAVAIELAAATLDWSYELLPEPERIILRRLAVFAAQFQEIFAQADPDSRTIPLSEWLTEYGSHLGNVRAALDWAFAADGDVCVGVELTVAVVPLSLHLADDECRRLVERALGHIQTGTVAAARTPRNGAPGGVSSYPDLFGRDGLGHPGRVGSALASLLRLARPCANDGV